MGSTINPRARGGSSLSGELRASRDDRQQIRRLVSKPTKPTPAAAPAAAGALSGAIIQGGNLRDNGGGLDMGVISWSMYGAPDWTDPPSWLTQDDPSRPIIGAGWYILSLELDLGWPAASAPSSVALGLSNSFGDGNAWNYAKATYPVVFDPTGTRKGIQTVVNHGHAILDGGYPLMLQMGFSGSSLAGPLSSLGGYSSATATWYIARLGG